MRRAKRSRGFQCPLNVLCFIFILCVVYFGSGMKSLKHTLKHQGSDKYAVIILAERVQMIGEWSSFVEPSAVSYDSEPAISIVWTRAAGENITDIETLYPVRCLTDRCIAHTSAPAALWTQLHMPRHFVDQFRTSSYTSLLAMLDKTSQGVQSYIVLESDVALFSNFHGRVRQILSCVESAGLVAYAVNLYIMGEIGELTSSRRLLSTCDKSLSRGNSGWGTQAYLLSNDFISFYVKVKEEERLSGIGIGPTDVELINVCDEFSEVNCFTYFRSLVQHTGVSSSLFNDASGRLNQKFHLAGDVPPFQPKMTLSSWWDTYCAIYCEHCACKIEIVRD